MGAGQSNVVDNVLRENTLLIFLGDNGTNGSITSGQGTEAITFTAGASGTTGVGVQVTIGSCSANDGVAVVIDGTPPPIRPTDPAAIGAAQSRAGEERSQPVAAAPPADSVRLTGEAEGLQAMQRELGAPGIDLAKVNEVRAALADGSYRVDPQQIATRMLALDSELGQ
mgnify:CR=1 FL=1